MKIGYNIRKIREILDMKQAHLAKELKISLNTYGKIERDEVNIDIKRTEQIARIFGIPVTILISYNKSCFLESLNSIFQRQENDIANQHLQSTIQGLREESARLHSLIEKVLVDKSYDECS